MKPNLPDGLTSGSEEERAVSPVVGVALLIAITVILAAVIGFVVLETNSDTTDTKNARLDFAGDASSGVTVTHEGGATFAADNVAYKINGGSPTSLDTVLSDSQFSTGDEFTITGLNAGDRVVVLWDDPESDREIQLATLNVSS